MAEPIIERPIPRNNRPLRLDPEPAKPAPEVTPKVTEAAAPPVVEKVTETSRTAAEMAVGRERLEYHKKRAELRAAAAAMERDEEEARKENERAPTDHRAVPGFNKSGKPLSEGVVGSGGALYKAV